jgi:hypothetical protein
MPGPAKEEDGKKKIIGPTRTIGATSLCPRHAERNGGARTSEGGRRKEENYWRNQNYRRDQKTERRKLLAEIIGGTRIIGYWRNQPLPSPCPARWRNPEQRRRKAERRKLLAEISRATRIAFAYLKRIALRAVPAFPRIFSPRNGAPALLRFFAGQTVRSLPIVSLQNGVLMSTPKDGSARSWVRVAIEWRRVG